MIIWLGLYEIGFMRTPDYAATSAYVDLSKKIKKPWSRALINASLRQFLREPEKLNDKVAKQNSIPAWIEKSVTKDWPNHSDDILTAFNSRAPLTLRVNCAVSDRATLTKKFNDAGLQT